MKTDDKFFQASPRECKEGSDGPIRAETCPAEHRRDSEEHTGAMVHDHELAMFQKGKEFHFFGKKPLGLSAAY